MATATGNADGPSAFISFTDNSTSTYIDPTTLKRCKHRWAPRIRETADGWTVKPKCSKCDIVGSPDDVSLRKLVKQMGKG